MPLFSLIALMVTALLIGLLAHGWAEKAVQLLR